MPHRRTSGLLVSLVVAMQAAGLIIGPLIAAGLLATTLPHDLIWRLMLAFGAIPALSVFYLRRQIQETPRFTAMMGHHDELQRAVADVTGGMSEPSRGDVPVPGARRVSAWNGFVTIVRSRRLLAWLLGASLTWFVMDMDFAYCGNTISSPLILKALDPHKNLLTDTLLQVVDECMEFNMHFTYR